MSYIINKWVRLRIILVGLGLGLLLLMVGGRFFQLQVILGPELREQANREVQKLCPVLPVRGHILDRRGTELAISTRVYSVVAHPRKITDPARLSQELAPILGINPGELKSLLGSGETFVWVKRHLTPEKEEAFRTWQESKDKQTRAADGDGRRDEDWIYLLPEAKRYYPQQALAGHVLGFCNIDGKGLEGLEFQFEDELYGKPKKVQMMVDARGRCVVTEEKAWDPEVMGHNVVLTLDRTIQYIAEKELMRGVEKWKAAGGLVMAVRPQTGEILAMAQVPTMDPNRFAFYPEEVRRNRLLTHAMEPGSSFKIFVAAAALDAQAVRPTDQFHCENGVWHLTAKEVIHDVHSYGSLTVQGIIQKSSNIGAAKLANKVGSARLHDYLKAFGFGSRTGIQFPGENAGLLKNLRLARSPLDRATCAFGQGVSVTPLQLTMALAAMGNEGVLMEPRLVKRIENAKGETVEEFRPRPLRRVLSVSTARQMLAIMETVTQQGGTAVGAAPPGFTAAGKTGTAQKLVGRAYSHSKFNAVFIGMVPADNPVLAISVIVDEPKGAIYGGVVAAPIFKEVAAQALRVMGYYPPTPNVPVLASLLPAAAHAQSKPEIKETPSLAAAEGPLTIMPDLQGKTIRQVLDVLHRAGIRCRLEGSGLAVSQEPAPGTPINPGDICSVKFQSRL
ncbi:MAG: penicillin-binding transpeptidase domain-containing protein [Deltaproteobacteria bacterium]|nr:penicillin-binding transpeptidase domain-containing protein [Deltaproteobacteria bacterium]